MNDTEREDYRVSLKEFILRIMDEREKSIEHRLTKLNELREEVTTDRGQFLKIETFDARHKALTDKVEGLQKLMFIGLGVMLALEVVINIIRIFR